MKLSLFADDMIFYIKNSEKSTQNLLELLSNYCKVIRLKINIQKSITFIHSNNKQLKYEVKHIKLFKLPPKIY